MKTVNGKLVALCEYESGEGDGREVGKVEGVGGTAIG